MYIVASVVEGRREQEESSRELEAITVKYSIVCEQVRLCERTHERVQMNTNEREQARTGMNAMNTECRLELSMRPLPLNKQKGKVCTRDKPEGSSKGSQVNKPSLLCSGRG